MAKMAKMSKNLKNLNLKIFGNPEINAWKKPLKNSKNCKTQFESLINCKSVQKCPNIQKPGGEKKKPFKSNLQLKC